MADLTIEDAKRCPYCEGELLSIEEANFQTSPDELAVCCGDCFVEGPTTSTGNPHFAVALWNSRTRQELLAVQQQEQLYLKARAASRRPAR